MTKQTLKFNDGEITTDFNKTITVHEDLENNETWLCIPGLPSNGQANKIGRVTPPILTKGKHYFIVADDHKGNSFLGIIQGDLKQVPLSKATLINNKHFIKLAQRFLDDMKKEVGHE